MHTEGVSHALPMTDLTIKSPEPVSVLQVVESCGAGVGRHIRALCKDLSDMGHRVSVAYSPHRMDEAFERFIQDTKDEVRFFPLQLRREVSVKSDLRSARQLSRIIHREGPFDVVHGHSSKGGAVARLAGSLAGVPTVYTPHGLVLGYTEFSRLQTATYTAIERTLGYCATSRMIAVSADERDLVRELNLVPDRRLVTVENGIEDSEFEHFRDLRRSCTPDSLTLGSVLRFSREKAPEILVEAFVQLAKSNPRRDLRLVLAGDGPCFEQTREQVKESGFEDRISLLGWRTDVREILETLDVYVLSSLSEGGPYSILEAMAGKLPVVCTSVPGIEDTVGRVPGNIVVPVANTEALAEGMSRMVIASTEHGEFQRIGEENHAYARRNYTQKACTRKTLEIYRQLCGKAAGSEAEAGAFDRPEAAHQRSGERVGA